jgi:hypothetical protein
MIAAIVNAIANATTSARIKGTKVNTQSHQDKKERGKYRAQWFQRLEQFFSAMIERFEVYLIKHESLPRTRQR